MGNSLLFVGWRRSDSRDRSRPAACAATSAMSEATAAGWETYTAWLAAACDTVAPIRSAIARWAAGGIILSSVVVRYQLGLARQAASVMSAVVASAPQGTWAAAMNSACSAGRSPANEAWNCFWSRKRKPLLGGRIGGWGHAAGNPAMREPTDSPVSGANAAM